MPKKDDDKKVAVTDFVAKRPDRYRIAKGRSVICRRGTLVEGQDIKASDLSNKGEDAQADLDRLIERGYVEAYK